MKKESPSFHITFQLGKKIIFSVRYYRCGNNNEKYFSTSAAHFNHTRADFDHCGQAQKELLIGFGTAMRFYKKWDNCHTDAMTESQYTEMVNDLLPLKERYNFLEKMGDWDISFYDEVELSRLPVKKMTAEIN